MNAAKGTALSAGCRADGEGGAPKSGYDRDEFGLAWFDTDRNGRDTRKRRDGRALSGSHVELLVQLR